MNNFGQMKSAENGDDEWEKRLLKRKLQSLVKKSTFHGISHISNTERMPFKLLYTMIFFAFVIFFALRYIAQTNSFLYRYLAYEVDTVLDTVKIDSAEFPAITICNLEVCGFTDYDYQVELDKFIQTEKARDNSAEEAIEFRLTTDKTKANLFWAREIFLVSYDDVKLNEVLNNESMSIGNMLISCRFSGQPCHAEQFEFFQMGEFQKCFKFNSQVNKARKIDRFSKEYGFKVELFIGEPDKCRSPLATTSGLNIFIHNQTNTPTLEDDSILVQQGTETDIGVYRTFMYRIPAPYSDCINKDNAASSQSRLVKLTLSILNMYQQQYCLSLCYQEFLLLYCDCFDHTLPGYEPTGKESCPIFVDSTYNCIYVAKKLFYNGRNDANCSRLCPSECESIMYSATVSTSQYPTDTYARVLNQTKNGTKYENTSLTASSILSLNIFYKTDEVTVINEKPTTDIEQFLCEFGGMLGLFLGCGFMSFIEIFELVVELGLHKWNVRRMRRRVRIQSMQQQQQQPRRSTHMIKTGLDRYNRASYGVYDGGYMSQDEAANNELDAAGEEDENEMSENEFKRQAEKRLSSVTIRADALAKKKSI